VTKSTCRHLRPNLATSVFIAVVETRTTLPVRIGDDFLNVVLLVGDIYLYNTLFASYFERIKGLQGR
jgi:hypothetical protein